MRLVTKFGAATAAAAFMQVVGASDSAARSVVVVTATPRVVVVPKAVVVPRVGVPRVVAPKVAPRPVTSTRVMLNTRSAVRAGQPRTVVVTTPVVPVAVDGCAHLRSRAGSAGSSNHRYWMARYNRCLAQ